MRVSLVASLGILGTLAGVNCLAQGEKAGKTAPVSTSALERMPESLETLFALSAAPPHLRDSATVFLLDPGKGYVLNRKGTNGVSCILVRSDWRQWRMCGSFNVCLVDGALGAVWAPGGRLSRVLRFAMRGGKIAQIEILADRERLDALDLVVLPD